MSTQDIPLDKIRLPSNYVREGVDEEHIEFLADDIGKRGLLEPLLVKPIPQGLYEIINGVHRYHALKKLGWGSAPCVVREASDQEAVVIQVLTNYRARRLKDFELVRAVGVMHDALGMRLNAVAKELGYSKGYVSRLYNIYKDPYTYEELKNGSINLEEAYSRVKGRSGQSLVTKHGQEYRVRCIICKREGGSDDYHRPSICLEHAQHLQRWVKAAREVYMFKGDEGLRELSKKLHALAGELVGRKESSPAKPGSKNKPSKPSGEGLVSKPDSKREREDQARNRSLVTKLSAER